MTFGERTRTLVQRLGQTVSVQTLLIATVTLYGVVCGVSLLIL